MFKAKFNDKKFKTNVRLCINRLKLVEKKKTEMVIKASFVSQIIDPRSEVNPIFAFKECNTYRTNLKHFHYRKN